MIKKESWDQKFGVFLLVIGLLLAAAILAAGQTNDPENPEMVLVAKSDWGP